MTKASAETRTDARMPGGIFFKYDQWATALMVMIVIGFLVVGTLGVTGGGPWLFGLVAAIALAGVSGVIGGFFGFLFGIPRAQQRPDGEDGEKGRRYAENTNLEQISDWLTKILIGITLTQFETLKDWVVGFSRLYAPAFLGTAPAPSGTAVCVAVIAYFAIVGFLSVYLWTRLYMEGALRVAGADTNVRLRDMMEVEQQQANEADSKAIEMVDDYLNPKNAAAQFDTAEVRQTVAEASYLAQTLIFDKAKEARSKNWREASTKPLMERTVPIFQGLIDGAPNRSHRYYGQLAYALKDKLTPDYASAETNFRKAISLRGDADLGGRGFYEFGLAVCLINTGPAALQDKPADAARRDEIKELLRKGSEAIDPRSEPSVMAWLKTNKIDVKNIDAVADE